MYTSYFSKSAKKPNAVSISNTTPSWFHGRVYTKIAPPWYLINKLKSDGDEEYFTIQYNDILNRFNPKKIFDELGENSILLCWEAPGKFCHRRLVAEWFESNLNVDVKEFIEAEQLTLL